MLIDVLQAINEGRSEKGRGSKAGREKFASKKGTKGSAVKARKSRVKVYDSIKDALNSAAPYGTIFSTKSADRLYVISKPTWGEKSRAGGNTRIAKGFTPGSATPSASWPSIKSHAVRTGLKHGGSKSKRLTAKYGPGKSRPEEKRYSGKKPDKKKPVKEAKRSVSGKLAELLPLLNLIKRVFLKEAVAAAAVGARAATGAGARAATGAGGRAATGAGGRAGAARATPTTARRIYPGDEPKKFISTGTALTPFPPQQSRGGTGGTGGAPGPEGPEGSSPRKQPLALRMMARRRAGAEKEDPGAKKQQDPSPDPNLAYNLRKKREFWKAQGRRPLGAVSRILRRGPGSLTV